MWKVKQLGGFVDFLNRIEKRIEIKEVIYGSNQTN